MKQITILVGLLLLVTSLWLSACSDSGNSATAAGESGVS